MSHKMSWYFFVITFRNVVSGAGGTVPTVPVVCVNIFVITRLYCKRKKKSNYTNLNIKLYVYSTVQIRILND